MELQHLTTEIIQRINQYFGSAVVRRIRLMQTNSVTPPVPTRPRSPRTLRTIESVEAMSDGPLRDALMSLGNAVLYR
jgi:hypothetical protein